MEKGGSFYKGSSNCVKPLLPAVSILKRYYGFCGISILFSSKPDNNLLPVTNFWEFFTYSFENGF
ncbi:hypothetical protein HYN48_13210 [Flavobacterium magnum]|uniref:Uncharacterized protein n=1 Tax=Flavobacterium magnum TaxID=2162713 RepID=A0A2S0RIB4_9FLAO|nr:hypothetical protein HYN48_13210 [Flavobacterium magnum]